MLSDRSVLRRFSWLLVIAACADSEPKVGSTAQAVQGAPTVASDKDDYQPGQTALLSGSGWTSGEDVAIDIQCTCGCNDTLHATADANGAFADAAYPIEQEHLGTTCHVTATGATSNFTAETYFTDGNVKAVTVGTTTYTLTYALYGTTTCSGAVVVRGSNTVQGTDAVTLANPGTHAVDATQSIQLTAPATSDQGGAFTSWTSTDPFTGSGRTICVIGATGTRDYTANFGAAPPSNHNPVVTCQDINATTTPSTCTATGSVIASKSDPDGDTVTCTESSGAPYPLGGTTVVVNCSDGKGGTASCTGTVTLVDDDAPAITCPPQTTVECTSPAGAAATFSATATDNCGAATPSCPGSGTTFPLGTTNTVCNATDASGNRSVCGTTVKVVDTTSPSITCPAPTTAECTGNHAATVDPGSASGSDLCGAVALTGPSSGSYPLGATSISFTAADPTGNTSACSTTVTVQDTTPPSISCAAPVTAECTGNHSATVDVAAPQAADVCGGVHVTDPAAASFPLGTTAVSESATDDSGLSASCSTSVTVVDTTPPTITCPAAVTAECTGDHSATVDVAAAAASDVCGGVSVADPPAQSFPLGTTSVSETATDDAGLQATCGTAVTIVDTTPPSITCPAPVTAECTGNGAATVDVAAGTASDICGGATVADPAAQSYPLGTTSVSETATDDAGLRASCTTSVTVVDTTPPTFATLAPQTLLGNCSGAALTFTKPIATDGCQTPTVTCDALPGNSFGANTIHCTAQDPSGNTATTTIAVTVLQPLQVKFLAPLADDNVADDINTDADVPNIFQVKSTIPHQVSLLSCSGADVTTSVPVSVTIAVQLRDGNSSANDTNLLVTSTGVGDSGGVMALVDGKYKYNLKTTGYQTGTASSSLFFDSIVRVSYTSAPGIVAGSEDVRLESK